MKLSVIIVNYNVKYFLEQCLHSVKKASENIHLEVFVVDNNSVDGSVEMVRDKFPEVILIANKKNVGFSVANNQAIRVSKGEYILLLNPDTIVEHDTFKKVIAFMDNHPNAGGLGIKMVDGQGNFLPESKRGLPTPAVAFYKISGLSKLFPKSKRFAKYHLGNLDNDETNRVEILAGAFMLLRKSVLDKVGLLDETFFMYGEDIDLSYRIIKAGYDNYYYPEARIIHYKGESTKKGSINYVFVFYNAMVIFAKKHYSQKNARLFSLFINLAIYFRAFLAILDRFAKKIFLPLADALLLSAGIILIKNFWESNVIYADSTGHFPEYIVYIMLPLYIFIWIFSLFLSGGYDKPINFYKIIRGYLFGTIAILTLYGLLGTEYRFSRAIIIFGALWGGITTVGFRYLLSLLKPKNIQIGDYKSLRFAIIADKEEGKRITDLLQKTHETPEFVGLVSANEKITTENGYIGTFSQIKEIIKIYKINEIIFSAKDIPAQDIINQMSLLHNMNVSYKIAPPESYSIIGSNSINTSRDLFIVDINSIEKSNNKRNKRVLDIFLAAFLLITYPINLLIIKRPFHLLSNAFNVLIGKKTWIGYCPTKKNKEQDSPTIRKGILNTTDALENITVSDDTIARLNLLYARNYNTKNDLDIIIKKYRELGR